eukprot:TRINITY_DN8299_c0_g2_i1.p1 TRINITY_DN8299_c0_g2~~TRINITY_DN8299_c0_g2_i1.p1  ORF type:complete len:463 (-),score=67.96 TRINITY_DN8299_c0_g2_i1:80-1468(-)
MSLWRSISRLSTAIPVPQSVSSTLKAGYAYFFSSLPFHEACKQGDSYRVNAALQTGGIDVNARNEDGQTGLIIAARYGHVNVVQLLLKNPVVQLETLDPHGLNALMWAATNGHLQVCRLLLKYGVALEPVSPTDRPNSSSNLVASVPRSTPTCRRPSASTIGAGTSSLQSNHLSQVRLVPNSALMCAAAAGHTQIVELLISHGADIIAENPRGETAVDLADAHQHKSCVQLLLRHGAILRQHQELAAQAAEAERRAQEAEEEAKKREAYLLDLEHRLEQFQQLVLQAEYHSQHAEQLRVQAEAEKRRVAQQLESEKQQVAALAHAKNQAEQQTQQERQRALQLQLDYEQAEQALMAADVAAQQALRDKADLQERLAQLEVSFQERAAALSVSLPPLEQPEHKGATTPLSDTDSSCIICYEQDRTHCIVDCGHKFFCADCIQDLAACPMCRIPVTRVIRVYES